ncbi:hypothetical protein CLPUN_32320 [Clostridium puniceum]|uniref:Uncharacterized protein n=1 Tax=Clostridium puniceum TaxID=29367 RepID=A0A1S8TCT3_9CLOT|nr:hypothetical protein [Clostridium puniceum]OOM75421.1 hypothetical protein CLPUN_32320 [Clostridium puniceum]
MKKILIAVIATSMLLTNAAFAASKTTNNDTSKNKSLSSASQFQLQINNPGGW